MSDTQVDSASAVPGRRYLGGVAETKGTSIRLVVFKTIRESIIIMQKYQQSYQLYRAFARRSTLQTPSRNSVVNLTIDRKFLLSISRFCIVNN